MLKPYNKGVANHCYTCDILSNRFFEWIKDRVSQGNSKHPKSQDAGNQYPEVDHENKEPAKQ